MYVQVLNNTGSYNQASSNFTVSVSGTNVSPSSFPGSISGTLVAVTGAYSVQATGQLAGYTASYSTGCTGNLINGAQGSCIITESATNAYNNYPNTYYPNQYYPSYPYGTTYSAPLTCSPSGQTVTIGANVTFTAQGGDVSQFNWSNSSQPNNTSYNIGRSYTTTFLSPGATTVTVTNGAQTATCSVNVVGYPVAGYGYNYNGTYPYTGVTTISPVSTLYPNVTVTPSYIPRLPNTGFEPLSASGYALALAFLIAVAFASYSYVRQAFIAVLS